MDIEVFHYFSDEIEKISNKKVDYEEAKRNARKASILGTSGFVFGNSGPVGALYQEDALRSAGIDPKETRGRGTWAARHPIASSLFPMYGMISARRAQKRIDRLAAGYGDKLPRPERKAANKAIKAKRKARKG